MDICGQARHGQLSNQIRSQIAISQILTAYIYLSTCNSGDKITVLVYKILILAFQHNDIIHVHNHGLAMHQSLPPQ